MNTTSSTLPASRLYDIEDLCQLRDERYSTKFYGQAYCQIIKPLVDSVLGDGGIPCFINEGGNPLPESTATCLLALHRLGLIDHRTIRLIQHYLFRTNLAVARLQSLADGNIDLSGLNADDCAWSASEGKSVWSTSQVLWALVGTGYDDIYKPVIDASTDWLLGQQYKNGGWALVAYKDNKPNVFVTSVTLYALKLCLRHEAWAESRQRVISEAIRSGCGYLIASRKAGKSFWVYDPSDLDSDCIEPTSTAMALWALHHCAPQQDEIKTIIRDGIKALRRDLRANDVWDNRVIVDGYCPDTGYQKVLQGFTPSIPLILLQLGVSPTDPMITQPLNLILNTRTANGWAFYSTSSQVKSATGYLRPAVHYVGSDEPMTFATALCLWTVEQWHKHLLRHNLVAQMETGNIQHSFTKQTTRLTVKRPHLAFLLAITGVALISLYFLFLYLVFQQSLSTLISNLSIKDFSNLFDSVVKLLFVPMTLSALLVNFYLHGRFSFSIVQDLWRKMVR